MRLAGHFGNPCEPLGFGETWLKKLVMDERAEEDGIKQEVGPINGRIFVMSSAHAGSAAHTGPAASGEDGGVRGARAVFMARGTVSAAGFEAAHARAARLHSRHFGR